MEPLDGEERDGGRRFRQAVAHHHVQPHGVCEAADFVAHGSAGRREEVAVLQPDGLLQQGVDGLLVKLILHAQHQRGRLALVHVVHVVQFARLQRVHHQGPAQGTFAGDALVHALVDLLPESRDTAHHRGPHLAKRLLHVGRPQVDTDQDAAAQAEVSPRLLEDVRQRQEVERHVAVGQGVQQPVVHAEDFVVIAVAQHHALGLAGGARRVEYVHQVVLIAPGRARVDLGLVRASLAQLQELVPIDRRLVARVAPHRAVEDNHLEQRLAIAEHGESGIVLKLFAHKEIAYGGVAHDVLHLQGRAGGVERDGDGAVGKGGEVHRQTFRLVLREDAHVLPLLHAERHECAGRRAHGPLEVLPRHGHPRPRAIIPVFQCRPIAIFGRLPLHQYRHFLLSHDVVLFSETSQSYTFF